MVIIPNADFAAYTETLTLDGFLYVFGFTWNTRDQAWFMSISRDNVPLLYNIKVVNNFELIDRFTNVSLPPGLILTVDIENINRNPGRDELGSAVKLAYVTESEVESGAIQ